MNESDEKTKTYILRYLFQIWEKNIIRVFIMLYREKLKFHSDPRLHILSLPVAIGFTVVDCVAQCMTQTSKKPTTTTTNKKLTTQLKPTRKNTSALIVIET